MEIHQIEYYVTGSEDFTPEEIRGHVMRCFSNNALIDAIATSEIVIGYYFVLFKFMNPVTLKVSNSRGLKD